MKEFQTKLLIVRLCSRIAYERYRHATLTEKLVVTQRELREYLQISDICLDWILGRTESEILKGIQDENPLAIEFDNSQLTLHNI